MILVLSAFVIGNFGVCASNGVGERVEQKVLGARNWEINEKMFGKVVESEEMSKIWKGMDGFDSYTDLFDTKEIILNIARQDYSFKQEEYLNRFHKEFKNIKESALYNDPKFQSDPLGSIPRGYNFETYKEVFNEKLKKTENSVLNRP